MTSLHSGISFGRGMIRSTIYETYDSRSFNDTRPTCPEIFLFHFSQRKDKISARMSSFGVISSSFKSVCHNWKPSPLHTTQQKYTDAAQKGKWGNTAYMALEFLYFCSPVLCFFLSLLFFIFELPRRIFMLYLFGVLTFIGPMVFFGFGRGGGVFIVSGR